MKLFGFIFFALILSFDSYTQSFSQINAQYLNGQVIITYDLIGDDYENGYVVEVRSNFNNFSNPLKNLSGSYGVGIKPGKSLSITWNPQNELPIGYDSQIQFKLIGRKAGVSRSEEVTSSEAIPAIINSGKIRKGKATRVSWDNLNGGSYDLHLFRNGMRIETLAKINASDLNYDWQVSKGLSSGTGYELRLLDQNSDQSISGPSFSIVSKVPLFLKLAPLLAVGGATGVLLSGGSDPSPGGGDEALPIPPDPN